MQSLDLNSPVLISKLLLFLLNNPMGILFIHWASKNHALEVCTCAHLKSALLCMVLSMVKVLFGDYDFLPSPVLSGKDK